MQTRFVDALFLFVISKDDNARDDHQKKGEKKSERYTNVWTSVKSVAKHFWISTVDSRQNTFAIIDTLIHPWLSFAFQIFWIDFLSVIAASIKCSFDFEIIHIVWFHVVEKTVIQINRLKKKKKIIENWNVGKREWCKLKWVL